MILSNNQSRATLCFLETCLIVGLLPLKIILITASWSWYTNNKQNFLVEVFFRLRDEKIIHHSKRLWSVERTSRWFVHKSLRTRLLWFVFPRISKIKSPKSIVGIPSILNPASKEMLSHSVETVRNWNLFLTHPTYWNKHVTSKNAQCSHLMKNLNSQDLLQNRNLETVPICIVFHITCVMNTRDQTR